VLFWALFIILSLQQFFISSVFSQWVIIFELTSGVHLCNLSVWLFACRGVIDNCLQSGL